MSIDKGCHLCEPEIGYVCTQHATKKDRENWKEICKNGVPDSIPRKTNPQGAPPEQEKDIER